MRTVFDPDARHSLIVRLRSLSPESQARWGRMNAPQALCHMADQVRCALGDIPTQPRRSILNNRLIRFFAVHLLPWPKGRIPTVPEMLTATPGVWEEDRSSLEALLERAAERGEDGEWTEHPAFGRLSGREWGWLIYKHTDYHLRQFRA